MSRFIAAHATHPDAGTVLALLAAQVEAQRAARTLPFDPTLGLVYLTDHFASQADAVLAGLQQRWPGVSFSGCVGIGVIAGGVEHFDEPALALLLTDLPRSHFAVFSGRRSIEGVDAFSALVHADPVTSDLPELIGEMADRTASGYLFGGLASSSRSRTLHIADGVFEGGLSGVAFAAEVALVSRVTQGSQPIGPNRRITACDRNLVMALDGAPALPTLLADLGVSIDRPQQALAALRGTLVGITDANVSALARGGQFGTDTRVRHLIGIDPTHDAVAIGEQVEPGQQIAFCRRDVQAARRDLVRICAEIRDEVDIDEPVPAGPQAAGEPAAPRIAGALYVSCSGRGGPHFGGPSAEAQIVQRALGDVPLVGFFAAGEIARRHLYGYTGVLTVFVDA